MFPSEFKELLFAFNSRNVKYLVIGTYAVIVHSHPARYRQCKSRLCGVSELRCAARGLTLGVSSNRACFFVWARRL